MTRDSVTIDGQQIRSWFGLAPGQWPPDHYALLGLPAREADVDHIEQRVHECLMRVRSYQLSSPTLATEAMTQLAKAFDCLTDKERKKAYDNVHFPHVPPPVPSSRVPTKIATDTAQTPVVASPAATDAPLQWQTPAAPPPVRSSKNAEPPPLAIPLGIPVEEPVAVPLEPAKKKRNLVYLSSADVPLASTRRELYDRVVWTRRMLRAWNRTGKYAHKPRRRLVKAAEDAELTRLLHALDDVIQEMPGLLGEPGQVGYRVLVLNSQEPVAEHFKTLDDDHRIALALDWTAGRKLLEEYRGLLMDEVKNQRLLAPWQQALRAMNAMLTANWGWILLTLGLIGLLILVFVYIYYQ